MTTLMRRPWLACALLLLLCSACTSRSSRQSEEASETATFSTSAQEIGRPTDGLELQKVETEEHESFVQVVFDLNGDRAPASRAVLKEEPARIEVLMHGVRMDQTGNRPLVNEAGESFGSLVDVDSEPLTAYGRMLVLDDSAIGYELRLSRPSAFVLEEGSKGEVVVKVAKD